jgi:hypothetical protein
MRLLAMPVLSQAQCQAPGVQLPTAPRSWPVLLPPPGVAGAVQFATALWRNSQPLRGAAIKIHCHSISLQQRPAWPVRQCDQHNGPGPITWRPPTTAKGCQESEPRPASSPCQSAAEDCEEAAENLSRGLRRELAWRWQEDQPRSCHSAATRSV